MPSNSGSQRNQDLILEQQLELLFSDVDVPAPSAQAGQPEEQLPIASNLAVTPSVTLESPPSPEPLRSVEEQSSKRRSLRGLLVWKNSLFPATGALMVLLMISFLMIFKPGWAAQSNSDANRSDERNRSGWIAVFPTSTPNDQRTTPAGSSFDSRDGLADLPESGAKASRLANATPVAKAGSGAADTKRSQPEITRVVRSATPTASHVPSTPTAEPPTPTLVPAQPAHNETATPVPAWSIGLAAIPTPAPRIPLPDKAINIVLLGSDQRPDETEWRTDVIIVVSVNPELPSVSMLSIPRDTWLYIPNWTRQRINLADVHGTLVGYPGGGPGLVKATIEYNFGIHIDYFARVDFSGLMHIVDALGGIDVVLDCPVFDGFPDDPITEDPSVVTQIAYPEPGLYHLDGKHALWLARSRKTTSEFARSRRQHRILQGIWTKANELGYVARLPDLWEELGAAVQTDLSLDDVVWLASIGLQLDASQINSGFIDGRYLTAWVSPGGANVLLPHSEAIIEALVQHFNPYPYKAPQGLNQVAVWNGSGHDDWGLLAADRLLRNGFQVAEMREIDELHEETAILDFTSSSKGSPIPLLTDLFDADSTHVSLEAGSEASAPFRLVVGTDYRPCERPVPAQWVPTPTPSDTSAGN